MSTSFSLLSLSHLLTPILFFFFFFNDTATTEIYTLSLHDALPIWSRSRKVCASGARQKVSLRQAGSERLADRPSSFSPSWRSTGRRLRRFSSQGMRLAVAA